MSQIQSHVQTKKEFTGAIFAHSLPAACVILDRVPKFRRIVADCLSESSVGFCDHQRIQCAAAEMWEIGMLHEAFEIAYACKRAPRENTRNISEHEKDRLIRREQVKVLKIHRKKIVGNLQSSGILPGGFEWFMMQWTVLPVIMEIMKRWCLDWYFNEVTATGSTGSVGSAGNGPTIVSSFPAEKNAG